MESRQRVQPGAGICQSLQNEGTDGCPHPGAAAVRKKPQQDAQLLREVSTV